MLCFVRINSILLNILYVWVHKLRQRYIKTKEYFKNNNISIDINHELKHVDGNTCTFWTFQSSLRFRFDFPLTVCRIRLHKSVPRGLMAADHSEKTRSRSRFLFVLLGCCCCCCCCLKTMRGSSRRETSSLFRAILLLLLLLLCFDFVFSWKGARVQRKHVFCNFDILWCPARPVWLSLL